MVAFSSVIMILLFSSQVGLAILTVALFCRFRVLKKGRCGKMDLLPGNVCDCVKLCRDS